MSQETNRIKIRELDPTTDISSDDQLAIAVPNPDRTLRVSVSDVVQTGITLQAGSNISITKQGTTHTIAATSTAHDDSALASRVLALENRLNNLSVGSSVTTSPAPPVDAVQGDMWWDTNTARLYVQYNNVWVQCNPTGDSPVQVNLTGGTVTLPPVDNTGNTLANGLVYAFSSPEITDEESVTVNYPSEWVGGVPDKVLVSTRYPMGNASSQQWFQVVSFDSTSVTIFPQAQGRNEWIHPVIADILLIKNSSGVAESNCFKAQSIVAERTATALNGFYNFRVLGNAPNAKFDTYQGDRLPINVANDDLFTGADWSSIINSPGFTWDPNIFQLETRPVGGANDRIPISGNWLPVKSESYYNSLQVYRNQMSGSEKYFRGNLAMYITPAGVVQFAGMNWADKYNAYFTNTGKQVGNLSYIGHSTDPIYHFSQEFRIRLLKDYCVTSLPEGPEVVTTGVIQIAPGTGGQTTSGPWTDLTGYSFTPGDVAVVTDVSGGSYTEPEDPRHSVGAVAYGNEGVRYNAIITKTWGMDVTADPSTGKWTATYTGTPPTLEPATGSFTLTIYRSG